MRWSRLVTVEKKEVFNGKSEILVYSRLLKRLELNYKDFMIKETYNFCHIPFYTMGVTHLKSTAHSHIVMTQ